MKESDYREQMISLGTWHEAFAPEVHQLCILERELSRVQKQWKATAAPGKAPDALDPHFEVIQKLRRDILSHRESLGLTPKGLRRLRAGTPMGADDTVTNPGNPALTDLLDRLAAAHE